MRFGVSLGIACCVSILGCGSLPVGSARISALRTSIERATQAGALACAPRELALARAHYDFAQIEMNSGNATRAQHHVAVAEQNVGAAQVLTPARGCAPGGDEVPAIPSSSARPSRSAGSAADGGDGQAHLPAVTVKNADASGLTFNAAGVADTARVSTASQMSRVDRNGAATDLHAQYVAIRVKPARLTSPVDGDTRLDEAIAMSVATRDLLRGVVLSIGDSEL